MTYQNQAERIEHRKALARQLISLIIAFEDTYTGDEARLMWEQSPAKMAFNLVRYVVGYWAEKADEEQVS